METIEKEKIRKSIDKIKNDCGNNSVDIQIKAILDILKDELGINEKNED